MNRLQAIELGVLVGAIVGTLLGKIWARWSSRSWAGRTLYEYMHSFPGQCPLCAYDRHWAWSQSQPRPLYDGHPCPDRDPELRARLMDAVAKRDIT